MNDETAIISITKDNCKLGKELFDYLELHGTEATEEILVKNTKMDIRLDKPLMQKAKVAVERNSDKIIQDLQEGIESEREQVNISRRKLADELQLVEADELSRVRAGERTDAMLSSQDTSVKIFIPILSVLLILSSFAFLGAVVFVGYQQEAKELVYMITTALLGLITSVSAFWYGSSHGSKIKEDMLAKEEQKDY